MNRSLACKTCLSLAALDLLYVPPKECFVTRTARPVLRVAALGVLLLGVGLVLSGCGRKGGLDAPPASIGQPQPSALETDAQGREIAPPGEKKRLLIDRLLD
jgi:predicted small lipoprotein YifL